MEDLHILTDVPSLCACVMDALTHLLRDHTGSRFAIFGVIIGLLGSRIVFLFLIFYVKWNSFSVHIWNLTVAEFGAFLGLCSIFIFFYTSDNVLAKLFLLLAYLFLLMQCTTMHFLLAVNMNCFLVALFQIWERDHCPNYSSALISTILSAVLWLLSCLLLSFLCLEVDRQTIMILSFHIFAPLIVISSQTLMMSWCNLHKPGKLHQEIMLGLFFSLVIWAMSLFFVWHHNFSVISLGFVFSSLALVFTTLNGIFNPILYILIGKRLMAEPGRLSFHFQGFSSRREGFH